MSIKHLGDRFDVHTGGNDNKFPHHEDEIAQSEGAVGHPVVSIWVHGGFLQMGGQKMAKSAKNIKRVTDLADAGHRPAGLPLVHVPGPIPIEMDFTWEALETADQRVKQLRRHVAGWDARRRRSRSGREGVRLPVPRGRRERPRHAGRRPCRERPRPLAPTCRPARSARCSDPGTSVLGLDLEREARAAWEPTEEIRRLMAERDAARAAKDYARSDELRDELQAMGLEVMDTADGHEGPPAGLKALKAQPERLAEPGRGAPSASERKRLPREPRELPQGALHLLDGDHPVRVAEEVVDHEVGLRLWADPGAHRRPEVLQRPPGDRPRLPRPRETHPGLRPIEGEVPTLVLDDRLEELDQDGVLGLGDDAVVRRSACRARSRRPTSCGRRRSRGTPPSRAASRCGTGSPSSRTSAGSTGSGRRGWGTGVARAHPRTSAGRGSRPHRGTG